MIDIDGGDIILLLLFNFWTLLNLALISLLQRFLWPKTIKNADKNKKKLVFYYPLSITFLLFFFRTILGLWSAGTNEIKVFNPKWRETMNKTTAWEEIKKFNKDFEDRQNWVVFRKLTVNKKRVCETPFNWTLVNSKIYEFYKSKSGKTGETNFLDNCWQKRVGRISQVVVFSFLLFFFCLIGYFFSSIFSWRSWPKTKEELKKKKNKVTIRNLVLALTVCNVVFSLFFYCIVPLTINFIKSQLRLKQW